MIPISLTIEGLYSYQKRQTIDFTQLTNAGLFGIFGAVGSGKSSILEAITFALYGETERLNARDERSYNMMNLKSNRCFIEFEFMNYENKIFKIQREYKRNLKNFKSVTNNSTVFYEKKENQWTALPHTNAEKIIGINYNNFKRTIIIPQGKFRDFIELGNKDRTEMMKEIFHLHRFDLQENIRFLSQKTQDEVATLKGKLESYQDVSEETILEQQKILNAQQENLKLIENEYNSLIKVFQALQLLKSDFELLTQKQNELETLQNEQIAINDKRMQLAKYKHFNNEFLQILTEKDKIQKSISQREKELWEIQKSIQNIEKRKQEIELIIKEIQPFFDELPTKKEIYEDLLKIIEIIGFKEEIKTLDKRIQEGERWILQENHRKESLENSISVIEKEIETLKSQKIDTQTLTEVGQWFQLLKNKQQTAQEKRKSIDYKQREISKINDMMRNPALSLETLEHQFEEHIGTLSEKRAAIEKEKNHLEVQKQLSQYSENLHSGVPCPLCGALEHPAVYTSEDVLGRILVVEKELENIKNQQDKIQKEYAQEKTHLAKKEFVEQQIMAEIKAIEHLNNEIVQHKNTFVWKDFNADNEAGYEAKRKQSIAAENQIIEKDNLLNSKRKELAENEKNRQKYQKAIDKIQQEKLQNLAKIHQNSSLLKILKVNDYENKIIEDINAEAEALRRWIRKIEFDYQSITKEQNEILLKFAAEKASEKHLNSELNQLKTEWQNTQGKINNKLIFNNIENINTVKECLDWNLDIEREEGIIHRFDIRLKSLTELIGELKKKHSNTVFDANDYAEKETKIQQLTQNLDNYKKLITITLSELERLNKNWIEKQKLLQQSEAVNQRNENLNILKKLFHGGAFVEYISFIFLKQLCENANIRFQKMTKNQLSIQFSEKNNFEIIDYLNEGRVRNVKTLSGGQYFQVALCLALALAEIVQVNAKTEQNFFFIDEGFGTLDSESVYIVFETLSNLRKENRIVGIISHLSELKEQIPTTIQIVKTEKGSVVMQGI